MSYSLTACMYLSNIRLFASSSTANVSCTYTFKIKYVSIKKNICRKKKYCISCKYQLLLNVIYLIIFYYHLLGNLDFIFLRYWFKTSNKNNSKYEGAQTNLLNHQQPIHCSEFLNNEIPKTSCFLSSLQEVVHPMLFQPLTVQRLSSPQH